MEKLPITTTSSTSLTKKYENLELREDSSGTLYFNPATGRTYRVGVGGRWEDVSLAFPVNDYTDYCIRLQNMRAGTSNYMPKFPPPLEAPTEDISYEEV